MKSVTALRNGTGGRRGPPVMRKIELPNKILTKMINELLSLLVYVLHVQMVIDSDRDRDSDNGS